MQPGHSRTFFFVPPVRKPTGGVAVLWRMAAMLREAGREAFLALREPPAWRPSGPDVPAVDLARAELRASDVWVVPEGWGNALAPGLSAGARCLLYVQNWAYLFNGLPQGVDWRSLPVSFAAVSRPVSWFIGQCLGAEAPVLRPGIDLGVFKAPQRKPGELTVAYMPRKNKALADQVRSIVAARGNFDVRWVEIAGMGQAQVAEALGQCHCFLATGFPEGCPLPPLEAMACGAIPAGFAGFGGWDYMRQAAPGRYLPECPMDEVPWGGNGFYAPDNDALGAALALEAALALWRANGPELEGVRAACARTARAYGLEEQRKAVLDFWERLG